jgi:hypothetical protein
MATFGKISNPLGSVGSGGYGDVNPGLPNFLSNVIKLILVAGGLFVLFNGLFAGFTYITSSGDQQKIEKAAAMINMSLMGLVVMAAATVLTGIVSWLLFGSPLVIISPNVYGPGSF